MKLIKSIVFFAFFMICINDLKAQEYMSFALFNSNQQYVSSLDDITAQLRKTTTIDKNELLKKTVSTDPAVVEKALSDSNIKKTSSPKIAVPATTTTTSGTIFDIAGASSTQQFISLVTRLGFFTKMPDDAQGYMNRIELYKLEKGTAVRSFSIPPGSTTATKIPIQIVYRYPRKNGAAFSSYYEIIIPSGNLQPGEYAFVDKGTASADGSSIRCFAFSIKQ